MISVCVHSGEDNRQARNPSGWSARARGDDSSRFATKPLPWFLGNDNRVARRILYHHYPRWSSIRSAKSLSEKSTGGAERTRSYLYHLSISSRLQQLSDRSRRRLILSCSSSAPASPSWKIADPRLGTWAVNLAAYSSQLVR